MEQEASNWTVEEWGSMPFLLSLKSGVKALVLRLLEKLDHIFRVPYIFCTMSNQETAKEIVKQIGSCAMDLHHRTTKYIWAILSDAIILVANGGLPTPRLKHEEKAFAAISIDD